jgi:dephospho-CoA kinase
MTRAIVLTGGIGSGKSVVAEQLAQWGAHVVDADQLARDVVTPGTDGLDAVLAEFGSEVMAADGSLDRAALADIVFSQPERLAVLEAIVHPRVAALAAVRLSEGRGAPLLVYEVPLPGPASDFPAAELGVEAPVVVVVDAPDDVRHRRLLARGLSETQIVARMAAQPSRAEWLAIAQAVIDNGAELASTRKQVGRLWQQLTGAPAPVGPAG